MIKFGDIRLWRHEGLLRVGTRQYQFVRNRRGSAACCASSRQRAQDGHSYQFELLCHLLLGDGHTQTELYDLLYAGREDGGPLDYPWVVRILIYQLMAKVVPLGLALAKERTGGGPRYRIVRSAVDLRPPAEPPKETT